MVRNEFIKFNEFVKKLLYIGAIATGDKISNMGKRTYTTSYNCSTRKNILVHYNFTTGILYCQSRPPAKFDVQ